MILRTQTCAERSKTDVPHVETEQQSGRCKKEGKKKATTLFSRVTRRTFGSWLCAATSCGGADKSPVPKTKPAQGFYHYPMFNHHVLSRLAPCARTNYPALNNFLPTKVLSSTLSFPHFELEPSRSFLDAQTLLRCSSPALLKASLLNKVDTNTIVRKTPIAENQYTQART